MASAILPVPNLPTFYTLAIRPTFETDTLSLRRLQSEDAIRSQLGDLRDELRQYEARRAIGTEFDAPAADIPETIADEDLPQGRMLTEEESREMKENLARDYFDMSLDEFTEAWKIGKFDGDEEKHGDVVFLASMLPEYWAD